METKIKKTKHQRAMQELEEKMSYENRQNDFYRARAVHVGTCFGGITEISMRMNNGQTPWAPLQPVEVIELIHQLAANVGCHIHIQPRKDFASWRGWNHTEQELEHFRGKQNFAGSGWPPHAKQALDSKTTTPLPHPNKQPGLQQALITRNKTNEEVMATEKAVGRKRIKRTTAST